MIRIRRTLGSGPPPSMEFGELAYSDTDSQLYVGRPDGSPMIFDDQNHTHDIPIVIPLTPIGGFFPYAATPGFRNELRIWPTLGKAILRFGLQSPNALSTTALSWTEAYSLGPNEFLLAPSRASLGGVWNPANQFTIIQGNNLLWVTQATVGQQIDFLVGNVEICF